MNPSKLSFMYKGVEISFHGESGFLVYAGAAAILCPNQNSLKSTLLAHGWSEEDVDQWLADNAGRREMPNEAAK